MGGTGRVAQDGRPKVMPGLIDLHVAGVSFSSNGPGCYGFAVIEVAASPLPTAPAHEAARGLRAPVLLVGDDAGACAALRIVIDAGTFSTLTMRTDEALASMSRDAPALVVMYVERTREAPDLVRRVRGLTRAPIVVISDACGELDIVAALDAGADDHVERPFRVMELHARLRAVLRRAKRREAHIVLGPFELDPQLERFTVHGRDVALTPKELGIMRALMTSEGPLSADAIFEAAWAGAPMTPHRRRARNRVGVVRVWICQLRRKIEPNPARPRWVLDDGDGYRLATPAVTLRT